MLLQQVKNDWLTNISFNLFGEYDNSDVWDAAEEQETEKKGQKEELCALSCELPRMLTVTQKL